MKSTTPGTIEIPTGKHFWTEPLTIPDYCRMTVEAKPGSEIIKCFHGPLIRAGMLSEFHNLYVKGQGDRFSGGGIEARSGDLNLNSWIKLFDCIIEDTQSHCVEVIGESTAYQMEMRGGSYTPFNDYTIAAIKLDVGEDERNGNRHFTDVKTGSNIAFDFGNCDNAQVTACEGGAPVMGVKSKKISFTGNRWHTVMGKDGILRPLVFKGIAHSVTGGTMNTSVTFHESLQNFKFENVPIGDGNAIIDNSSGIAGGNLITLNTTEFLPNWNGEIGPLPGRITAREQRRGDKLWTYYVLKVGTETILPDGPLQFFPSRPFANAASGYCTGTIGGVPVTLGVMAAHYNYSAGIVLVKPAGGLLTGADLGPDDYIQLQVEPEI